MLTLFVATNSKGVFMKYILTAFMALWLATMEAKADDSYLYATGAIDVAAIASMNVPFGIVAGGGTTLMAIIWSGYDPWTPVFSSVELSYPQDPNLDSRF